MITASCAEWFLHSFSQFLLVIFLLYCSLRVLDHYFCDELVSRSLPVRAWWPDDFCGLADTLHCHLIYGLILLCRESLQSSLHLQFPHHCDNPLPLWQSFFLFAPLCFIWIKPAINISEDKEVALFALSLLTCLTLLCTLINMEMKNTIKKLWCHITGRKEINWKTSPIFTIELVDYMTSLLWNL